MRRVIVALAPAEGVVFAGSTIPVPRGDVMAFAYAGKFRVLQLGDVGGEIALYGTRAVEVAPQVLSVSAKTTH